MASSIDLSGKVAFVTGSTRGIGWATAVALARSGATVVLHGRANSTALEQAITRLRTQASPALIDGVLAELSDPGQINAAFRHIFQSFGRLDILVNNAGVLGDALIGMISSDLLRTTYEVNAIGLSQCLQAGARLMARAGGGSIVNLTSIVGTNGNAGQLVYAGTKAAVIGITKAAAKELAPQNIRVNAVAPGFIDTDMVRGLPEAIYRTRMDSIAMGRIGRPEDVADAILFLVSDLSRYVTGQVLGVDGGMLI